MFIGNGCSVDISRLNKKTLVMHIRDECCCHMTIFFRNDRDVVTMQSAISDYLKYKGKKKIEKHFVRDDEEVGDD